MLSTGPGMLLALDQLLLKVEERKELSTSSRFMKWATYWKLLLFSRHVMSNSLRPHGLQHARPPSPSSSPGVCPSSCPLNRWFHPTISSSVALFFFCLQSFPMSQNWESGPRNRLKVEDNKCGIRPEPLMWGLVWVNPPLASSGYFSVAYIASENTLFSEGRGQYSLWSSFLWRFFVEKETSAKYIDLGLAKKMIS